MARAPGIAAPAKPGYSVTPDRAPGRRYAPLPPPARDGTGAAPMEAVRESGAEAVFAKTEPGFAKPVEELLDPGYFIP